MASAVLLAAGLAKTIDVPSFYHSLESWSILPGAFRPAISVLLPLAEIAIGLSSLLGLFVTHIRFVGLSLLLGMLAVSVTQYVAAPPAQCSCFGPLTQSLPGYSFHVMTGVLLFLIFGFSLGPPVTPVVSRPSHSNLSQARIATRGFTLLETLLVVLLLGILVSLMIPILSRSRDRAREMVVLSDLRTHASTFTQYTNDYRDYFPYAVHPEGTTILRCPSRGVAWPIEYFQFVKYWQIFMADLYYDGDLFSRSFMSPFESQVSPDEWQFGWTSYMYPCVFFTRPEYWDPYTRREPTSQFGATRGAEVVFPAMKSMMVEYTFGRPEAPGSTGKRRFVSFVDGHAQAATQRESLVMNAGDGTIDVIVQYLGHFPGQWWPFQHTLYGVRGRDLD